jgi:tRNA (mo5U34)-methyltransferase
MKLDYDRFFTGTTGTFLEDFHDDVRQQLTAHVRQHGRAEEWDGVLAGVPTSEEPIRLDDGLLRLGGPGTDYSASLLALKPWRKGPFNIGQTFVDTEWRSDWKWQRIQPHISDLRDRTVLDIGCGNGYHLFRMLAEGASLALGVDPTILFNYQFQLMQTISAENQAYLLPLKSEHLPAFNGFDTVFSMGVLYHRRSPLDHLAELLDFLRPGGELVLETLVVPGDDRTILIPKDRYAKMRNVWFIPSPDALTLLAERAGFRDCRIVDVSVTSTDEQRATAWMDFQSLPDFLDPADASKTIEGYPAPTRATLIAEKP